MVLHAVAADTILSDEEMVDPRWCPLQQRLGGERDARQGQVGGQRAALELPDSDGGLGGPCGFASQCRGGADKRFAHGAFRGGELVRIAIAPAMADTLREHSRRRSGR